MAHVARGPTADANAVLEATGLSRRVAERTLFSDLSLLVAHGETLVVRGGGVPRLHGRGRGDLVCLVEVEVPKRLSREQKRLLKDLGKTFDES